MRELMRAEAIRLRHATSFWFVAVLAVTLPVLSYLSDTRNAYASTSIAGGTELRPEIASHLADVRALYAFPGSMVALLNQAPVLWLAAAVLAATWIGADFSSGAIRNLVLAEPRRGRLLAARIATLIGVISALVAALFALGVALPFLIPGVGAEQTAGTSPAGLLLVLLWAWTGAVIYLVLAVALAIITRSTWLSFAAAITYFFVEGVVSNLLVSSPLASLRDILPGVRLQALGATALSASGWDGSGGGAPAASPGLGWLPGFTVSIGWVLLLVLISRHWLRRAEITE